jgi:hypothetical protein
MINKLIGFGFVCISTILYLAHYLNENRRCTVTTFFQETSCDGVDTLVGAIL